MATNLRVFRFRFLIIGFIVVLFILGLVGRVFAESCTWVPRVEDFGPTVAPPDFHCSDMGIFSGCYNEEWISTRQFSGNLSHTCPVVQPSGVCTMVFMDIINPKNVYKVVRQSGPCTAPERVCYRLRVWTKYADGPSYAWTGGEFGDYGCSGHYEDQDYSAGGGNPPPEQCAEDPCRDIPCAVQNIYTCVCECPPGSHLSGGSCVADNASQTLNPTSCQMCDSYSQFGYPWDLMYYWYSYPLPPSITPDVMRYGAKVSGVDGVFSCNQGSAKREILSSQFASWSEIMAAAQADPLCIKTVGLTIPHEFNSSYNTVDAYQISYEGTKSGTAACDGMIANYSDDGYIGSIQVPVLDSSGAIRKEPKTVNKKVFYNSGRIGYEKSH